MRTRKQSPFALRNIQLFIAFRVFFNARFYYPVFTILFLDYGLTIEQFAILNSVWAATIVLAEVPSGALADIIGRKTLLMTTSLLMVAEMSLIGFVPLADISLVFWAFLFNRVLSGLAEAMASGADEALAYDTLAEKGNMDDWPKVLSVMMRCKSLASILTMSFGAAIYDPDLVNKALEILGSSLSVDQQTSMRFPVFLTLILGILSCITVILMRETDNSVNGSKSENFITNAFEALKLTLKAGKWILCTPFALAIILFGMVYDHVLRMLITMTSQYFRLILLPEASFGILGAGLAMVGLFLPKIAEKMAFRYTPLQNMLWLSLVTMLALTGLIPFVPYFGLLPVFFVSSGIMLTSFFSSHYLNRITESHQRATVLSFKSLAFNLAYGALGVAFAVLIDELRKGNKIEYQQQTEIFIENTSFKEAIFWFSPYGAACIALTIILSWILLRNSRVHLEKG